jgi:DNA-binding CsgD family transcriptional regulator
MVVFPKEMQYFFIFILVGCLSVGVVTTLFAFAIFFRYKSRLEYLFLAFLTSFTLRVVCDTAIFFVSSFLSPAGALLYFFAFGSRITLACTFVFVSLFIHRLTGVFQTTRSRILVYAVAGGVLLFFVVQFLVDLRQEAGIYADPYAFYPVDLFFYALPVYPAVIFFALSRRVKNLSLFRMIRNLFVGIFAAFPFLMAEDIFGSITLVSIFSPGTTFPFRVFPFCYLMIYGILLYSGFKNFIAEKSLSGSSPRSLSKAFIDRFGITSREQEIILLMREGMSNKRIADALFISTSTVKNHFHNIFEKSGALNRVELIRMSSS